MKKYNTRPIDFTGCHPVIAEALKRGEAIECWVWSNPASSKKVTGFVVGYEVDGDYPYRIAPNTNNGYAEPIPIKTRRIMPPERAIPVLIKNGWAFTSAGYLTGPSCVLVPKMYALMGGDVDGEANEFAWPPCIIEEVEDDE